jgi:hypothetical protein
MNATELCCHLDEFSKAVDRRDEHQPPFDVLGGPCLAISSDTSLSKAISPDFLTPGAWKFALLKCMLRIVIFTSSQPPSSSIDSKAASPDVSDQESEFSELSNELMRFRHNAKQLEIPESDELTQIAPSHSVVREIADAARKFKDALDNYNIMLAEVESPGQDLVDGILWPLAHTIKPMAILLANVSSWDVVAHQLVRIGNLIESTFAGNAPLTMIQEELGWLLKPAPDRNIIDQATTMCYLGWDDPNDLRIAFRGFEVGLRHSLEQLGWTLAWSQAPGSGVTLDCNMFRPHHPTVDGRIGKSIDRGIVLLEEAIDRNFIPEIWVEGTALTIRQWVPKNAVDSVVEPTVVERTHHLSQAVTNGVAPEIGNLGGSGDDTDSETLLADGLKPDDFVVLHVLYNLQGATISQYNIPGMADEIAGEQYKWNRSKVHRSLQRLIKNKLAHQPNGPKGGYAITAKGVRLARKTNGEP